MQGSEHHNTPKKFDKYRNTAKKFGKYRNIAKKKKENRQIPQRLNTESKLAVKMKSVCQVNYKEHRNNDQVFVNEG